MLDINFIRENPEKIKKTCELKFIDVDIDKLLEIDKERVEFKKELDELNRQKNEAAKARDIEKGKEIKDKLKIAQEKYNTVNVVYTALMDKLPSVPSEDTPVGKDDTENVELRAWGQKPKFDFKPKEHFELGVKLGVIDSERAAEVAGSRFTYLKGDLARIEFAIVHHVFNTLSDETKIKEIAEKAGLDGISTKPFIPVVPPVMIRPEIYQKMGRLDPKEDKYHLEQDDLWLIGSAEHTLGPLHMNGVIKEEDLPIRYVGFSTAFRREAGSYGKDVKGILRMHQFDKIEMESFTLPENGIKEQNLLVAIQEYLMQELEIPYRAVSVCTGDMGGPDVRQIDIEAWMPGQDKYRETHSADFMGDFQARRLNIRTKRAGGEMQFVHMNDATTLAIGRILIAIMENNQEKDGSVRIPKLLQKYIGKEKLSAVK